jgi:2-methylfumaryl-CoA hydratase
VGEVIDHVDGVTIEEAEHMMATRLWQNTSKTHFDATPREDRKRLIYGGHVMSMARALSFNGLGQRAVHRGDQRGLPRQSLLRGRHGAGLVRGAGHRQTPAPGVGAIRLRLVATKDEAEVGRSKVRMAKYLPDVLLDLDYWALMPV